MTEKRLIVQSRPFLIGGRCIIINGAEYYFKSRGYSEGSTAKEEARKIAGRMSDYGGKFRIEVGSK